MKTKIALIATAALLVSSSVATVSFADDKGSKKGGRDITLERVLDGAEAMFSHVDADNNGVISQAELDALPLHGGKRGAGDEDRASKRDGMGKKAKGKGGPAMIRIFLGEDGLVEGMTWDAVQAQIGTTFGTYDADSSGTLTRDEFKPIMEAARAARKARMSENS